MAAGLGFKDFTTGEVLTAADVDGYLMQGIWVFASAAARNAAVTSPQEGNFAFTKDTNSLWYYDGAAWVASGATGDIEGVTAGTGISGGGTSGTVTITNSMATAIDAKGDLIVGTGADTFARLAVSPTNGHTLVADSAETTGLKWAAPSSGAMTKIVSTTFSAVASQQFLNCFSSTYKSYYIEFSNMFDSGAVATPTVQFNWYYSTSTDIGNGEYRGGTMYISQTGVPTTGQTTNGNQAFWSFGRTSGGGQGTGGYLNVSSAGAKGGVGNEYQNFQAQGMWMEGGDGDASDWRTWVGGAIATPNQIITGFRIALSGGNISGTVVVYGLEK